MTEYKNVGLHPEELVGGVMLGPGETIDLDDKQVEENQRLIDEGVFISIGGSTKTKSKEGS